MIKQKIGFQVLDSSSSEYGQTDGHGVAWTVTVWSCLAVARPCSMEQDCVWPQQLLTTEQKKEEDQCECDRQTDRRPPYGNICCNSRHR